MSSGRKDSHVAVGSAVSFFKVVLRLALLFLVLTLFVMPAVQRDSPEFVIAVLTLIANGITVIGSYAYICFALRRLQKQG